ncbi:hypothetical protein ASPVEDRAFT_82801 [Aspergillus versicolor CBS 583.65]|uniref:F-box domain-containing protein n=1 Tax=Aspergillus versicolor CBS 583.65 TaxID=1036611 RepID=A0A1L9PIB1_ASPVE|nr:uncharacterized protein ASPVEDRAFT_82801 [Aspergillus versicolor CBS 583.65]OJJ01277.1 hypothetical protein ASPVEDRAFT_82801 [Aspergillus versicolor CBS 583.65]
MVQPYSVVISAEDDFTRCILCGCPAATPVPVWLDVVRVLYARRGRVKLSGIFTKHHRSTLEVESDRSIDWRQTRSRGDNDVRYPGGSYFILHERCWQYAWEYFGHIRLETFYDVLRDVPPPPEPSYANSNDCYPCLTRSLSEIVKYAKPLPVPSATVKARMETRSSHDPFRHLPIELREYIGIQLDTGDFFNLRNASRAMSVIFHDNCFWRSRFQPENDRGWLLEWEWDDNNSNETRQVDWRQLYHATSNIGAKFDTTMRVREVLHWIEDKINAGKGLNASPLDFYGRALQSYHNNSWYKLSTAGKGKRKSIVSADFLASVDTIGISMISGSKVYEQESEPSWSHTEAATEIVALEFINKSGRSVVLGKKPPKTAQISSKELALAVSKYEADKRYRRRQQPTCPYDSRGAHVLCDAKFFRGFRIRYTSDGIHSIGVIQERPGHDRYDYYDKHTTVLHGYTARHSPTYDMVLDRVSTVVATFDGGKLVELGLRGSGWRIPLDGRAPSLEGWDVDVLRYGTKLAKSRTG